MCAQQVKFGLVILYVVKRRVCRIPTAALDTPSLTEEEVGLPASGLPRQIEGVTTGDRRSPVFRHMAVTKGAWQAPVSKERPGTPVFMT